MIVDQPVLRVNVGVLFVSGHPDFPHACLQCYELYWAGDIANKKEKKNSHCLRHKHSLVVSYCKTQETGSHSSCWWGSVFPWPVFVLRKTGRCLSIFQSKPAQGKEKLAQVGWHILSVKNECNEQAAFLTSTLRVQVLLTMPFLKKHLCEELSLTSAEHISFLMQKI